MSRSTSAAPASTASARTMSSLLILLAARSCDALLQPNPRPLAPSFKSVTALYSTMERERTAADAANYTHGDDDAVLTDVDARVLQAMMREDKLNLQEEQNMKKLLERGIRSKNKQRASEQAEPEPEAKKETKFSSAFFQKLGDDDNTLWKNIQRGAQDILSSAKIFVANRIERDAQLLGAIGLFAWERAVQDVGRALPAAANVIKTNQQFLLGNETAANSDGPWSRLKVPMLLTSMANDTDKRPLSIMDEMTTPFDEIRSVTENLRDILQASNYGTGGGVARNKRGLRSTIARGAAGSKERFAKSYQRKQLSVVTKEKENVVQTTARMTSGVIDSAWELKREMQAEPNEPGYRSKEMRLRAAEVTQQLKQSVTRRILGAGKREDQKVLSQAVVDEQVLEENEILNGHAIDEPMVQSNVIEIEEPTNEQVEVTIEAEQTYSAEFDHSVNMNEFEMDVETTVEPPAYFMDHDPVAATAAFVAKPSPHFVEENPETEYIVDNIEATSTSQFEPDLYAEVQDVPAPSLLAISFAMKRLDDCIERPETTWLRPNDLKTSPELAALVREDIEPIVKAMIRSKKSMMHADETDTPEALLSNVMDAASSASSELADILARQLGIENKETMRPPFHFVTTIPEEEVVQASAEFVTPEAPREVVAEIMDVEVMTTTAPIGHQQPEIVDMPVEYETVTTSTTHATATVSEGYVTEIVTDDDFDDAVGTTAKSVEAVSDEEAQAHERKQNEEPNMILRASLRSLDVAFFVAEKTMTVGIPQIMQMTETITSRVENARSEGLGTEGWEPMDSVQSGKKRY